jgi:hypothetical protein
MKTPQDIYNEAHAASVKTMGVAEKQYMLGWLCAAVAQLENELQGYQVPLKELGNTQTAFVHQGVHLVAEWSEDRDEDERGVHVERYYDYLWVGSTDILELVMPDPADPPDWLDAAIDRDIEESKQ